MMIDIPRLRGSAFDATPDNAVWRAGVNLWLTAWHSVPAASLDDDEAALAKAAGLGRDVRGWRKIAAGVLRSWIRCTDGRLYHPTVAEMALEAWLSKLAQRLSSGAGNAKRYGHDFDPSPIDAEINDTAERLRRINPGSKALPKLSRRRPVGSPSGSQEKGTGTERVREEKQEPDQQVVTPRETPPAAVGATSLRVVR